MRARSVRYGRAGSIGDASAGVPEPGVAAGGTSVRPRYEWRVGCQDCRRRSCHRVVTKSRGRGRFGTRPSGARRPPRRRAAAFRPRPARPRPPAQPASRPAPPRSRRRDRPDHDRDLALRRLREPLGELGRRPAHDLLEPLRQLTADGDLPLRRRRPRASAAKPPAAAATRTPPRATSTTRAPPTAPRAPPPAAAGSRGTRTAPPRARSATSAVSTADGPGSTVTGTPASTAARTSRAPGSDTPGRPASETSAIRSPPASRGTSSATRAASLCSW